MNSANATDSVDSTESADSAESRLSTLTDTYFELCTRDIVESCISPLITFIPPGIHAHMKDCVRIADSGSHIYNEIIGIDNNGRFIIDSAKSGTRRKLYVVDTDEGYTKYLRPFVFAMPVHLLMHPITAINSTVPDRTAATDNYRKLCAYSEANGSDTFLPNYTWFVADENIVTARMICTTNFTVETFIMIGTVVEIGIVDIYRQYCTVRESVDGGSECKRTLNIFNNLTKTHEVSFELTKDIYTNTNFIVCGDYVIIYDRYPTNREFVFRFYTKYGVLVHTMIDRLIPHETGYLYPDRAIFAYPLPPARFAIIRLMTANPTDDDRASYYCATRHTIVDGGKDGMFVLSCAVYWSRNSSR